jgi:hypothetical protein
MTMASPCHSIAAAISKTSPTGTVTVAAGTYSETLALDRNVTLRGAGAATTIIDGGGSGTVLAVPAGVSGTISGLTIRNGNSGGDGGGIDNFGTLQVSNTTISGNTAGYGGGIFNEGGASLVVSNSTVRGNTVASGDKAGAIYNSGTLTLVNTTINGNSAPSGTGGAIRANSSGSLTIVNSTISGNSATYGGGIAINPGTTNPTLSNTILSGNSAGTGPDCYGSITSQGNNLVQNTGSCTGFGSSDLQGVNPQLGSLQSNGGPNWTMAPAAGSPVIDAGNDATCAASPVNNVDERGVARPAGAHCDIGAYEVSAVRQSIAQGWNSIDIPLQGSGITSLSALVNSLNGSGQLGAGAITVTATYGNGRFSLFVPGYSADQTIQPSAGIFVFTMKSGTWTPSGSLYTAPQSVSLQRGWSYVSAPFPIGGLTASTISAEAAGCNLQEVARLAGGSYHVWTPGTSQDLTIPSGSAMWILCQNPATWQPS